MQMPGRHWRVACVVDGGHDATGMIETMSEEEQLRVCGRGAARRLSRTKRRAESGGRTWLKLRRTGAAIGDAGAGGGRGGHSPHGRVDDRQVGSQWELALYRTQAQVGMGLIQRQSQGQFRRLGQSGLAAGYAVSNFVKMSPRVSQSANECWSGGSR